MKMKILIFFSLAFVAIYTIPAFAEIESTKFLLDYGYLKEKTGSGRTDNPTPEEMQRAVLQFQRFNGLPLTGMIDRGTKEKMLAPRCGVKDVIGELAEYKLVSKWPKNLITWRINKYSKTSKLSPAEQKQAIRQGLQRWSDVSSLVFQETEGKATLEISFEKKRHGDAYPFDGRGRVLAHAFFPQNGRTHFDDDEIWINGKIGGSDLETVAAHEFGHALGLAHSEQPRSLMAPYYQIFPDDFKLHQDDVAGIQRLYGKKTPQTTTLPTVTEAPPTGNGFCSHSYGRIDAAMRISGNDFVFVDNSDVIDGRNGRKMDIKTLFPGGPDSVQAAVYSNDARRAYLFSGERVWAYSLDSNGRFVLAKKYPKQLSNKNSHAPEGVMQFNYYNTERLFLIKNGYFLEFIPYYDDVSPGRGYSARRFFTNIPNQIDAIISADREIYFIVKKKAYKMPTNTRRVDMKGKPVNLVFNKCQN